MSKPNSRSFRYSDKVAEIIEGFTGSSMNDKFENLVLYCFAKLETRKKDLKRIEDDIQKKRNEYFELCKQLQDVSSLMQTLKSLEHYGGIAARQAELIAKGLDPHGNSQKDKPKDYSAKRDLSPAAVINLPGQINFDEDEEDIM